MRFEISLRLSGYEHLTDLRELGPTRTATGSKFTQPGMTGIVCARKLWTHLVSEDFSSENVSILLLIFPEKCSNRPYSYIDKNVYLVHI